MSRQHFASLLVFLCNFLQLFELYLQHFYVPAQLVFEELLEFLLPHLGRFFRLFVEKRDLAAGLQKLSLSLVGELLQGDYFTVEALHEVFFLVTGLPDCLLRDLELLV